MFFFFISCISIVWLTGPTSSRALKMYEQYCKEEETEDEQLESRIEEPLFVQYYRPGLEEERLELELEGVRQQSEGEQLKVNEEEAIRAEEGQLQTDDRQLGEEEEAEEEPIEVAEGITMDSREGECSLVGRMEGAGKTCLIVTQSCCIEKTNRMTTQKGRPMATIRISAAGAGHGR